MVGESENGRRDEGDWRKIAPSRVHCFPILFERGISEGNRDAL
jgi:hypothetical protein